MFLKETIFVIEAFLERFVPYYHDNNGEFDHVLTIDGKVRFTFNNEYYFFAWFDGVEFKILSEFGENVLKMADDYDWTEEIIHFIKYGVNSEE